MYQHILFDLDGTLTDPKEGITHCVREALRAFGFDPTLEELTRFIGPPIRDSFREFYGLNTEEAEKATEIYRSHFAPVGVYQNEIYPGVKSMLRHLHEAGRTLCIASSKPEIFVHRVLESFELTGYFHEVVGAGLDSALDSKTAVLREALRRLDLAPGAERTIMVGDRKFDVEGAHNCGLPCVGVRYGYALPGELEDAGAEFLVGDPAALERFLLGQDE